MSLNKYRYATFACFSPLVMIVTFVLEIAMVFRLIHKFKMNRAVQLAILMLFALATFQLAEYGVCENIGVGGANWAKIGFVAITFLPALGLHLVYAIAHKKPSLLVIGSYALTLIWVFVFLFLPVMESQVCNGNYVIFAMKNPTEALYYTFYNAFLVIAIARAWAFSAATKVRTRKTALRYLIFGYLAFIVPSIVVRLLFEFNEGASSALPSIMCGFAILLAMITTFKVIPKSAKLKKKA